MKNNFEPDKAFELAVELRLLAARVRHLGTTLDHDQRKLKDSRWSICMDIAADLCGLADKVKPLDGPQVSRPKRPSSMRQVTVERVIGGRRIKVQSPRKPFAVCVEGRT